PESDVVQVMDGPTTDPTGADWYQVTDGTLSGWVDAQFLQPANHPANGALGRILSPGQMRGAPGVATGSLEFPLQSYTLTQGFGCTPLWLEPWNAALGCNFHNGVDLAAPYGSPIEAADGGTVEQAGWCDCGLGYYVKIDHGDGFETVYGHMSEYYVTPGEQVAKGETIGAVGSTGNSTGPHVHFIVDYQGTDENPLNYAS
ncbi:MAG TPA: M23 family metallopeptidase, partial [Thermomicrobiales bacterium]|nr:M23 family metallopeptidase [Thermomicrobiales bacterium]